LVDEIEFERRMYLTGRHGLDYGKLYHNVGGGYSMEKLKKVLKRISEDT
jgi:hypothetical protein